MTDQELHAAIAPLVEDGKLACRKALALADELDINPAQIGRVCNQHAIRIVNCQLGCFGSTPKKRD